MRKSLLTLPLVALLCMPVAARTLSPAEALSRALGQKSESTPLRAPLRLTPLLTVGTPEMPALYVFDQGTSGYLIVSADDVAAPVLGFSDNGSFDPDNMPDNLRWWLREYESQIIAANANGNEAYSGPKRAADRASISPLVTTLWDQGAPYDRLCPLLNSQQTVTGCVATAMAQAMNYFEWPQSFNANFSYKWKRNNNSTLTWKENNVTFDWANMLDSYSGSYSDTQAQAVATLMKACGYSVSMDYGVPANGGSGAPSAYVSGALVNTFNYDKGTYIALREYYSLSDWEDLIYDNLRTCGPVIYAGSNDSNGHCFICDGYSDNGYFHFNWGWSGVSDGYFLLSALNPEVQGIGGSTSGYNYGQEVVLGMKRPDASSKIKTVILCDGTFDATCISNQMSVTGPFYNFSTGAIFGQIGVRLINNSTGAIKDIMVSGSQSIPSFSGYSSFNVSGAFPTGSCKLYPIFKTASGEVIIIKCKADQAGYLDYTKSGSRVTITAPSVGNYSVTDLKLETPLYVGEKFLATGKAVWTGSNSVSTPLYGLLLRSTAATSVVAVGSTMPQEFLPDGTPSEFEYLSTWEPVSSSTVLTAGNYYFAMGINNGNGYTLVSTPFSVTLKAKPANLSITPSNLNIINRNAVDPENVSLSFDATCTSGYFFSHFIVAIFDPKNNNANVSQFNTQTQSLAVGETKTFSAKGMIPNAVPGQQYRLQVFNGSTLEYAGIDATITIADPSGIDDITADNRTGRASVYPNPATDYTVISAGSEISAIEIASLSGSAFSVPVRIEGSKARVDVASLPSGLYIARVATAAGIQSVKIIRK
ncbi:MAG: thiol protease/hemagglutinin PrtT [Staphylococcus sp.]|nr:thiol protease/hemagglutinin PrtT [Staphylococcus sp.]